MTSKFRSLEAGSSPHKSYSLEAQTSGYRPTDPDAGSCGGNSAAAGFRFEMPQCF